MRAVFAKRSPKPTPEDRFWEKVEQGTPDGCWPWQAARQGFGYGRFKVAGKLLCAHRFAYELTSGEIPAGQVVLHRCDNPPCCNPAHLRLGTKADNNADMAAKGRAAGGSRNAKARLNPASVYEARSRHAAGESFTSIAAAMGVDRKTISRACLGETWTTVPRKDHA